MHCFDLFLYCCCLSIFVSFQHIKLFNHSCLMLQYVKTDGSSLREKRIFGSVASLSRYNLELILVSTKNCIFVIKN